MDKPHLYLILETLDLSEWKEYDKFLKAQYNTKKDVLILFDLLRKHRKDLKRLKHISLHKKHFGHLSRKSFLNLTSDLKRRLDSFLVYKLVEQNQDLSQSLLVEAYNEKGVFHLSNLLYRKHLKRLKGQVLNLESNNLIRNIHHIQFFSDNPIKHSRGQELAMSCIRSMNYSTKIISKYYQVVFKHFAKVSGNLDLEVYPTDKSDVPNTPLFKYLAQLEKLVDNTLTYPLNNITKELYRKNSSLDFELKAASLDIVIHSITQRVKKGELEFLNDLEKAYEFGFDIGVLLHSGVIPSKRFINYVNIAAASNNFDKAEEFINKNRCNLSPKWARAISKISRSQIALYKGDYDKCLEHLVEIGIRRPTEIEPRIRWLQLCALFMLNQENYDFLYAQIKKYENYFRYNKTKMSFASYKGSLNLSKLLTSILNGADKETILNSIKTQEYLVFRIWLYKYAKNIDKI